MLHELEKLWTKKYKSDFEMIYQDHLISVIYKIIRIISKEHLLVSNVCIDISKFIYLLDYNFISFICARVIILKI